MAFDRTNLHRIGGGNGQTLWLYKTVDTHADVDTSGYFDEMADFMNTSDVILAVVETDGTPGMHVYGVINTGGVITLTNLTVVV